MGKPAATDRRRLKSLSHSFTLDLVVVAPSREVLEQHVLPTLAAFLRGRGLQRSEAKTRMVQSTAGLNFVGCEIKR